MYSSCDTPKGGFPHSELFGSKLICQLPEAYRRLSRPSSPIIAKASTTCSYSLDPITLTSLTRSKVHQGIARSFTWRVMPYFKRRFAPKLKFIFDAIKNSIVVSGTVRHEAVSANNADS